MHVRDWQVGVESVYTAFYIFCVSWAMGGVLVKMEWDGIPFVLE